LLNLLGHHRSAAGDTPHPGTLVAPGPGGSHRVVASSTELEGRNLNAQIRCGQRRHYAVQFEEFEVGARYLASMYTLVRTGLQTRTSQRPGRFSRSVVIDEQSRRRKVVTKVGTAFSRKRFTKSD
jgi:hypothetical protein